MTKVNGKWIGLWLGLASFAAAQTPNVFLHGIVLDESEAALPGASIHLKGLDLRATTDSNGKFRITHPGPPSSNHALLDGPSSASLEGGIATIVLTSASPVSVTCHDLDGTMAFQFDAGIHGRGVHRINIGPLSRLKSGIYALTFRYNNRSNTFRYQSIQDNAPTRTIPVGATTTPRSHSNLDTLVIEAARHTPIEHPLASYSDTSLRIVMSVLRHRVGFQSNGGSSVEAISAKIGSRISAPNPPTKDGYEFGGWYLQSSLATAWDFSKDSVTKDTTLFAKWIAIDYRDAWLHPFAVDDPFNVPLAVDAVLANSTTDARTIDFQTTPAGSNIKGTMNWLSWSIGMTMAKPTDPIVTIRDQTDPKIVRISGIRLSPDFQPPLGSTGLTADGASVLVQPDGRTAYDVYRLLKVSDTVWTSTSAIVRSDLQGTGVKGGRRAAGISYANGLIRGWEIDEILASRMDWMPHALSMSIPKEYLKLQPDSSDGQLVIRTDHLKVTRPVAVWPATQQDNQQWIPYSGRIAMGALFALPWDLDIDSLVTGRSARALARTLQRFGVYITDQSSSWALYVEPSANGTAVLEMQAAWKLLIPHMRRVTSNTAATPGGGTGLRRAPAAAPFAND